MKKLLLLPTLLLAINLGAATTETEQNYAQIAKQTEIAQTKTGKKSPSFLVRHADKLKKVSYIADGAFYAGIIGFITAISIESSKIKIGKLNLATLIGYPSSYIGMAGAVVKLLLDTPTKYAMSKKHTFELEALQAELDAIQQEKVVTEKA